MPYVTTWERIVKEEGRTEGRALGLEEGLRKGLLRGIEGMLEIKFGTQNKAFLEEIGQITDMELLEAIHQAVRTATSLDEVRRAMAK